MCQLTDITEEEIRAEKDYWAKHDEAFEKRHNPALSQLSDYQAVLDALDCMADDLHNYNGEIASLICNRHFMAKPVTALEKAVYEQLKELNK